MEFVSFAKCVSIFVQFFCILTPFFVLSMFVSMTGHMTAEKQRKTAIKTTTAILIICLVIYFLGRQLFELLGLTLDAFRIGAGAILFLSAVKLLSDAPTQAVQNPTQESDNISVVPLAIPFAIGPGTIGALMVMSSDSKSMSHYLVGCAGLTAAIISVGVILLFSSLIERIIGRQGIKIMSKLTGLILAGMSAQIVFTGIKNFLEL